MVKVELMCQIRAVCHTTCMNTLMITTSFDTLIYSLSLTLYLRFNHLLIVIKFPCGFTVKVDIDIWHSHISIRLFANRRETCILISDAISHGVVSPYNKMSRGNHLHKTVIKSVKHIHKSLSYMIQSAINNDLPN